MARYDYRCEACDIEREETHSMKETPKILCEKCDGVMYRTIPKTLNFVLKGNGWTGKDIKEKSYRTKRHKEMGQRMAKAHEIPKVQPNYKGNACESWQEAKNMAVKDGVDNTRYENQVKNLERQEQAVQQKRKRLLKGE